MALSSFQCRSSRYKFANCAQQVWREAKLTSDKKME